MLMVALPRHLDYRVFVSPPATYPLFLSHREIVSVSSSPRDRTGDTPSGRPDDLPLRYGGADLAHLSSAKIFATVILIPIFWIYEFKKSSQNLLRKLYY